MKILLLAYYYPPIESAGGERPLKMANRLPVYGHEIFVLTATYSKNAAIEDRIIRIYDPSHNKNRKKFRKWQWLFFRLWTECLNRCGIYFSIFTPWKKAVIHHSDAIIDKLKPHLVLATYPPVETLEIGLHFAQKFNLPLIADFRDGLLFEAIESKRLRRFVCARKAYTAIERQVVSEAAALITVSEPLSQYFCKMYDNSCVATVPNGFDPDETQLRLPDIDLEPDCFHIVHSGRFSLSDVGCTILPLVQALNSLLVDRPELNQKLRLHFLGELNRREKKMLRGLSQCGVAHLHGTLSREYALAFQRRADLLLLVTATNRSSVATTKIFEYLQARRPILALTPHSFAAEIIKKCRSGWIVSPLAVNEIKLILERIINDPVFYQDVDLSTAAIADYSINISLGKLNKLLLTLDKSRPT